MKKLLQGIFIIFVLTGCGTTPYQPITGKRGYSDTQLQSDIFKVSFSGNSRTSKERAGNLALLRASELTLESGFKYFVIIGSSDKSSISYSVTQVGKESFIDTDEFPVVEYVVKCFSQQPNTDVISYDALFLQESIRKKYEIKNK